MSELDRDDGVPPMKEGVREQLDTFKVAPVGGAMVTTFAHQIDYAKQMSRGREAIPKHLRDNVGACLAVVDISIRFGFSPFMVANKTYLQADRLCFESQLVHAMIERSGILQKRLRFEHGGENNEDYKKSTRTVRVIGLLKGEHDPFVYESPPLKDLHPGHVTKVYGSGESREEKKFVSGSQLWDDKPDIQLIYNATYDWARLYCPDVLMAMGIPPPDQAPESEHRFYGPDGARDGGTITALSGTRAAGHEGGQPAHIDQELENIAPGTSGGPAAGAGEPAETEGKDEAAGAGAPEGGAAEAGGASERKKRQRKPASAAKAEKEPPADTKKEPAKAAGAEPPEPKSVKEWDAWARAKIVALGTGESASSAALSKWWNGHRALRNNLGVTQTERMPVENVYLDTLEGLKDDGK